VLIHALDAAPPFAGVAGGSRLAQPPNSGAWRPKDLAKVLELAVAGRWTGSGDRPGAGASGAGCRGQIKILPRLPDAASGSPRHLQLFFSQ